MSKLVIGCGYLGIRVAQRWSNAGETVYAVTRSAARAEVLRGQGLQPVVADVTDPASLGNWPNVETVLYAVGFDRAAGKSKREVYVAGLASILDALPSSVRRLIYVSSTSVYGQQSGEWIDESRRANPVPKTGASAWRPNRLWNGTRGARSCILLPCRHLRSRPNSAARSVGRRRADRGASRRLFEPDSCRRCGVRRHCRCRASVARCRGTWLPTVSR